MPLKYNPFTKALDFVRKKAEPTTLEELSNPPPGCKKIKNIYVDPKLGPNGQTVVIFKDEPEE